MKDKIARMKKFVQDHPVPFAAVAGSITTFVILAKTDRLDLAHNYTWYSFKSREDLAKEILETGRVYIDCNHCDRVLKLIIDPSKA